MTQRSPERIEFLKDIIIIAVEGGVDYWAFNTGYDPDAGVVQLMEDENDPHADDAPWMDVDINVVAKGLTKIKDGEFKINTELRGLILAADVENDASNIDAFGADAIIQAALFGELVYG